MLHKTTQQKTLLMYGIDFSWEILNFTLHTSDFILLLWLATVFIEIIHQSV